MIGNVKSSVCTAASVLGVESYATSLLGLLLLFQSLTRICVYAFGIVFLVFMHVVKIAIKI